MKKIKVLIIILISILIVICGILAYLYFGTNTLKSNKKMFNKYIEQINLSEFVNFDDYIEYAERTVNESHTSDGSISLKIEDYVNESFKFETNSNKDKKYTKGEISYYQDEDEKLKITYLNDNDLYAIKCFYKQYLAIKEEDLPEFLENIGIDMDELNETLNTLESEKNALSFNEKILSTLNSGKDALNLNEKEEYLKNLNNILKKYLNVAINEIPNKNYVKIKKQEIEVDGKLIEADGYKLTLDAEDVLKILNKIISTAESDEELYNLIKEVSNKEEYEDFEFSDYQKTIQKMEKELNSSNINEDISKLEIFVYNQGEKTVKLYAKMEGRDTGEYLEFSIENNKKIIINLAEDNNKINIAILKNNINGENEINISFKAIIDGEETVNITFALLLKTKSLNEYETSFTMNAMIAELGETISIEYNNITEFKDDIEIESLEEKDYVLINTLTEEQLKQIGEDFIKRLNEKIDVEKTLIGSISYALNEGLFTKASTAREATQKEMEKETLIVCVVSTIDENGNLNFKEFKKEAENRNFEVNGSEFPCTCINKESKNEFNIDKNGSISIVNDTVNNKVNNQKTETQIAQVREVIILVKAEMLADYYQGNKNEPTTDEVKKRIEKYLDDSYVINVTKDPSNYIYIVSAEGLDLGEDNKIDLSSVLKFDT